LGEPSRFRWIETQPLPEGLEALVTTGHVPGHTSIIVRGETRTVIAADALLSREHDEQVLTMIPYNRAQYHLDRARLLALGGYILPGHDRGFLADAHATDGGTQGAACRP
jgi:glyoxylase-like metal-dependent hydrolase (beta-lactamase superfamily II)